MIMKVIVDKSLCQGHSVCLGEAPEVFNVLEDDEGGYPMVEVLLENPPEELHDKVRTAAKYCPNGVITIEE